MHQHPCTGQMPEFHLQRQRDEIFLRFGRTRSFDMAGALLRVRAINSRAIFDFICKALEELQDGLREGVFRFDFTTALLVGPTQWNAWGKAERRAAGMMLRCIVGAGAFLLVELERKDRSTRKYRPIQPLII